MQRDIAPAEGKLGVMLVGLGAVATTYIGGIENVRRGRACDSINGPEQG